MLIMKASYIVLLQMLYYFESYIELQYTLMRQSGSKKRRIGLGQLVTLSLETNLFDQSFFFFFRFENGQTAVIIKSVEATRRPF